MAEHAGRWEPRERATGEPDTEAAYEAARIEFELRQAIRELRRRSTRVGSSRPGRR